MTTKTATHTPGPWIVLDPDDLDSATIIHSEDMMRALVGNPAVQVISIPLGKAAPDLLEACKAVADELVAYDPKASADEHHSIGFAVERLRIAIARAEGGAS